MFCTNCGKQLPDGTAFCTNCGHDLRALTQRPAPAAPMTPIPPVPPVAPAAPVAAPLAEEPRTPVMDTTAAPVEAAAMAIPNFSSSDTVMDVPTDAVPAEEPVAQPAEEPAAQPDAPAEQPSASIDPTQLLQTLTAGSVEFSFKLRTAEGKELTVSGKADVSVK